MGNSTNSGNHRQQCWQLQLMAWRCGHMPSTGWLVRTPPSSLGCSVGHSLTVKQVLRKQKKVASFWPNNSLALSQRYRKCLPNIQLWWNLRRKEEASWDYIAAVFIRGNGRGVLPGWTLKTATLWFSRTSELFYHSCSWPNPCSRHHFAAVQNWMLAVHSEESNFLSSSQSWEGMARNRDTTFILIR